MGIDFRNGIRDWTSFPQNDSIYNMKFLLADEVRKILHKIALPNYYEDDKNNITRDIKVLNTCDQHARETNDFYNGGRLEYYMNEWLEYSAQARTKKTAINVLNVINDIIKYNDNLERAKKEYCATQLRNACYRFNYAYHVKEEGYWKTTDEIITLDNGMQVYRDVWIAPVYWKVEGFEYLKGDKIYELGELMRKVQVASKIKFIEPSDWKDKISRTSEDNF